MANVITCFRMICSIAMFFVPAFSVPFYEMYIAAGISDMLDGFVARKTQSVSKLGARLDSIADFIFIAVCMMKILLVIKIAAWLWVWTGIVVLVKLINLVSGVICQKKLVMLHTTANKAAGLLLFLLPISMLWVPFDYIVIPVCIIATFAAIQEGHFIRTGRTDI